MKEEAHQRAERLIAASKVEGIPAADREWLGSHLGSCTRCAERAVALERAVASLRSVPILLNPAMVAAARQRVRLRAQELREHESRMRALWIACALSWVLGVVSAPLVWWGLEWIGQRIALPGPVRMTAFVLWWVVPAAAVAAVLTWQRSRAPEENSYAADTRR